MKPSLYAMWLSLLFVTQVASASQLWQQLPALQPDNPQVARYAAAGIKPVATIQLSHSLLSQLKQGALISLTLGREQARLNLTQLVQNADSSTSYLADSTADSLVLTVGKSSFFASFSLNGVRYTAHGNGDIATVYRESEISRLTAATGPDYVLPEPVLQQVQSVPVGPATADAPALIKVLVYYTASTDDLYDGDASSRIHHMFAVTNQIFADSAVYASVAPVKMIKVDYAENFQAVALSDLAKGSGPFTGLENIRYELGADLVTLIQPLVPNDNSCGIAFLREPRYFILGSDSGTYSVNASNCADYVMAHEFGHNLGLDHSRRQDGVGHAEPYALGYGVDDSFVTVMAYESAYYSANGNNYPEKIYKFASPGLLCNNLPCGIAHPHPDSADAVTALNFTVNAAAALYSDSPDLATIEQALAQVSSATLRSCISKNINWSAKYAALALDYLTCTGDEIDSLQGLQIFSSLNSVHLNNVTAADADVLQQMRAVTTLTLNGAQLNSFQFLPQMANLVILNLSNSNFSDISLLSGMTKLQQLNLSGIPLTDTDFLHNFQNLWSLRISNVGLTTLDFAAALPGLTELGVSDNQISSLVPLQQLALDHLELNHNQVTDLSPLQEMTSLKSLSLSGNKVESLAPLAGLNQLQTLNLSNNAITDISMLTGLVSLQSLNLNSNKLNSAQPLAALTELRSLYLFDVEISNIGFLAQLPRLTYLSLNSNKEITDFAPLAAMLSATSGLVDRNYYISLPYDNPMECWQQSYLEQIQANAYLQVSPQHCNAEHDNRDYDSDGLTNLYEVKNAMNPYSAAGSQLRKLQLGMQDFDGDGKADIAVRDTVTFGNYVLHSHSNKVTKTKFGLYAGDIPLAADFDGDGITDIAMRRPKDFMWYVLNSSDGKIQRVKFGLAAQDIPVVADYDGDGKADIAVFRPNHSMWYVLQSSDNQILRLKFGYSKLDTPVVGDFNGDGKADFMLRRGGTGSWYLRLAGDDTGTVTTQVYGKPDDMPLVGDFDGDGKTDLALYRASNHSFYNINSADGRRVSKSVVAVSGAIPLVQDYDGDGKADIALRNPANFTQTILQSSDGRLRTVKFGLNKNYIPFAANPAQKSSML